MAYRTVVEVDRVHRRLGRVRRRPQAVGVCRGARSEHPPGRGVAGAGRPVGARQLRRHLLRQGRVGDPAADRLHRRRRVRCRRGASTCARTRSATATSAQFLAAMESASGRSLAAWSAAWLETAGADRLAVEDGVLTRTPPPAHPADRPHTLDVAAFAGGREVARVDVVVAGGAHRASRASGARARRARSSCRTPVTSPGRRCRSTPRRWPRCRPGWPTCPTPRPAPCSGSRCWVRSPAPRSTPASRSRCSRTPGRTRRRRRCSRAPRWPRHEPGRADVPAARRAGGCPGPGRGLGRRAARAGSSPSAAPTGDALAVVAARVWAGSGSDIDRLRRWADGDGIPAVLRR